MTLYLAFNTSNSTSRVNLCIICFWGYINKQLAHNCLIDSYGLIGVLLFQVKLEHNMLVLIYL